MKWARISSAALLAFAFTACDSLSELTELQVVNENNPERTRALAEAGDIESLVGSAYNVAFDGQNDYGSANFMMSAAAEETSISWGNVGLQQLSSEPRVAWPNEHSWNYSGSSEKPWYDSYSALSSIYDAFLATAANPDLCIEIDCDRAMAFGKFVQGMAHGWLAAMYDSAFIFDENVDLVEDVLELQPYPLVMAAALGYFDEAITLASGGNWTLPNPWMNGNTFTSAQFTRVVHSYYARMLTQVARTPAERAAVNWAEVITHVDQGITEDFFMEGDGRGLWDNDLVSYGARAGGTWQRADYKTIGWTEISEGTGTGYANWLATSVPDRMEFELNVPDLRISPAGDPRGVGLDFDWRGSSSFPADRGTYHWSMYAHSRYAAYTAAGYYGPFPVILTEPQQLMKAEALYRTGNPAGAATIVNATRVARGGLPPATAADADLMDKIMYEYRIENFIACAGCAYFTRRGWGDLAPSGPSHHQGLVQGTQLHFAVPGQELEILQKVMYTYGGVGSEGGALGPAAASGALSRGGRAVPARMIYSFNGMETTAEKLAYIQREDGKGIGMAMLTVH